LARGQAKNQLVPVIGRGGKPQMQQTSRRSWTQETEANNGGVMVENMPTAARTVLSETRSGVPRVRRL
jgi:hypothetical protein